MPRLLKDPLLHFLAAGLLLYLIASAMDGEPDDKTIVVDRDGLLQFIQYRSKAFEPNAAAAMLDDLDAGARERLVRDFVREEALDREAKALGLERNDYVIRQRLVQKVEFLAEAGAPLDPVSDADVEAHYRANADRFTSPPTATFTQVFVSFEGRTPDAAVAAAQSLLERLRGVGAGFNDATGMGDRFLFHRNYVDRTDDYVRSQLGDAATAAIYGAEQPLNDWFGPFRSDYGAHVFFVSARAPARLAPLTDIFDVVKADLEEERRQLAIDNAIDSIVRQYRVVDQTAPVG
jgi:hypothetical protein